MILKIWRELPDIYIMIPVIGSCLTGASATSQAFLSLRVSVSSVVGGARTAVLEDICFLFPDVAVNPGGSGIPALAFVCGGVLRSTTHCGGGGGGPSMIVMLRVVDVS